MRFGGFGELFRMRRRGEEYKSAMGCRHSVRKLLPTVVSDATFQRALKIDLLITLIYDARSIHAEIDRLMPMPKKGNKTIPIHFRLVFLSASYTKGWFSRVPY